MVHDCARFRSDPYIWEESIKHHGSDDAEGSESLSAGMLSKYFAHWSARLSSESHAHAKPPMTLGNSRKSSGKLSSRTLDVF